MTPDIRRDVVLELARREPVNKREVKEIDGLAWHHAGGPGDPWSWAPYHIEKWGSGVIGYHSVILRTGEALKTAYDTDRTPGVANHNRHLLHLCFQGDLTQEPLTAAQVRAGLLVSRRYMEAYGIPVDRCRTHSEWQDDPAWATSCPGFRDLGEFLRYLLRAGVDQLFL